MLNDLSSDEAGGAAAGMSSVVVVWYEELLLGCAALDLELEVLLPGITSEITRTCGLLHDSPDNDKS
jgi:hypothetical protein